MHSIIFHGKTFIVREGETIRAAMMRNGFSPHNGKSRWVNCQRISTHSLRMGRSSGQLTQMDRWRLGFPPYNHRSGLQR